MRYLIGVCANLLLSLFVLGQNSFNLKVIKKEISSKKSTNYYPALMSRYKNFDSLLTEQEYKLIYYGYFFQKEFKWFGNNQRKKINEMIQLKKYNEANILCDSMLGILPVSATLNKLKSEIIDSLRGDKNESKKYFLRYKMFMEGIKSSGTGMDNKTAFVVIYIADEYEFVLYEFQPEKILRQVYEMPFDVISFKQRDDDVVASKYFLPLKN